MNRQKLNAIVNYVRGHGRLPTDRFGNHLSADDMIVWFGLRDLLTLEEQYQVKAELLGMAEAETFMDRLRRSA
ncbi:MAG: hypothetical protein QUV05_20165 [Phycisphaerae bacterium]|jgi:hypothetical protein|nr:hypothetical protein [Phycisphaerae bacterium]